MKTDQMIKEAMARMEQLIESGYYKEQFFHGALPWCLLAIAAAIKERGESSNS